ncbi:uncharacterized protein LOC133414640 isoform X3 [Phycodurus eques]|uniref:uncharacterized protein LOC133414640 isoform X3 n=1 Tax=Phycodurus eques TaxID=693459 RepID=UPI002ACD3D7A|nr:uncharacterized protein LOC133414640 isoform X3 [Phycodurus eques]
MLSSFDVSADASLPVMASAAVLACAVVLALICLRCRDDGSPVSIREASNTDESAHFRLVRQHHSTARLNSDLLSPFITASDRGSQRSSRPDLEPTESESNHSYQNSYDERAFPESSTGDYLIVLPEDEAPGTNRSGASTPSSGSVRRLGRLCCCSSPFENGRHVCVADDRDYLNVIPLPRGGETPPSPSPSPPSPSPSSSSSQNDDDDDGEGKYVNEASVSTVMTSP